MTEKPGMSPASLLSAVLALVLLGFMLVGLAYLLGGYFEVLVDAWEAGREWTGGGSA